MVVDRGEIEMDDSFAFGFCDECGRRSDLGQMLKALLANACRVMDRKGRMYNG